MVHTIVVMLSYMCLIESATVSLIKQILLFTLDVQKPKSFQLPPDQGLCPWTRWGLRPQTSVVGSRYRARRNLPQLFQIPPDLGCYNSACLYHQHVG